MVGVRRDEGGGTVRLGMPDAGAGVLVGLGVRVGSGTPMRSAAARLKRGSIVGLLDTLDGTARALKPGCDARLTEVARVEAELDLPASLLPEPIAEKSRVRCIWATSRVGDA